MVIPVAATVKPTPRFRKPPWDRSSPEWLRIDAALPADHPARALRAALDQLDWTDLYAACPRTGSEAYPPDLMLAIVLCALDSGQLSPARWARDVRDRDSLKWLGFGIQPSRSRCYAFRDRMAGRLPGLLRQVLQIARAQGLTSAARAALDGTAVAAVASRHKLLNQATLEKRLGELDTACAAEADAPTAAAAGATDSAAAAAVPTHAGGTAEATPPARRPAWMASTARGRRRQQRRYHDARKVLEARIAANARRPPSERRDPAKLVVSPSEPDAVLGLDKSKVFRPLYNVQLAYDLDSELVLGCGAFALATDIGTLEPMLATLRTVTGRLPAVLLADAKYANLNDIAVCEREGVMLYAPESTDAPATPAQAKAQAVPKSAFTWHAERREYRCPEGHAMPYAVSMTEERAGGAVVYDYYRCPGALCRACPRNAACTTSPKGRTVRRAQGEEAIERLRQRMATAPAKALYRRRRETVERGFADAKWHRNLTRFHGRGLERATTELELLVLAHNLKVLARHQRSQEVTRVAC